MQKLKLQNKWNEAKKCFEKDVFELKETDKSITGKIQISSKQKDKWINKAMPFIVFKSRADESTQNAVKSGKFFEADFVLGVNEFTNQKGETITYLQMIINFAKICDDSGRGNVIEAKGEALEDEIFDDEIPF